MFANTLIFDMDGVVVDTEHLHAEAEKLVCDKYNIIVPEKEWDAFKGKTSLDIFSYIVKNFSQGTSVSAEEMIREKKRRYLEIAQGKMLPIPGALEFARYAKRHLEKIALVTSSSREVTDMVLKKYKLNSFFDVVITGDDIQNGKPHPEPYLAAIKKLREKASDIVVVEDSLNGILSAKNAGCNVIGITTSFPQETLITHGADLVIHSFDELYELF
jgi:beta-phosphoglucomutase